MCEAFCHALDLPSTCTSSSVSVCTRAVCVFDLAGFVLALSYSRPQPITEQPESRVITHEADPE